MDIQNILYSLIPLILIIVFSWLFSFLGSRLKKQAQERASSAAPEEGSVMDLLTGEKSEDYVFGAGSPGEEQTGQVQRFDPADWRAYRDPQGPQVSPKPIKPKWWGA